MVVTMETDILSTTEFQKASGARLEKLIGLLDLSKVEAAEIMGVSKHVLNHWLRGNNPIQPYALYRLCRAKGANAIYIHLGDWSGLPHRLARHLEDEMRAAAASGQALGRSDIDPAGPSSATRP